LAIRGEWVSSARRSDLQALPWRWTSTATGLPGGFSGDLQFDRSYFQGDLSQVFSLSVVLASAEPIGGRVQIARFVANLAPIPEPATALMLGAALAGLAFWRRREVP
jgi:hypothetical protein